MGLRLRVSSLPVTNDSAFHSQSLRYLRSWFHIFDALVIIVSFLVDVLTRGVVEEVASLVVILRLWRFVKIIEEMSVGASEQMEDLELRIEQLEKENSDLKSQMKKSKPADGEEAGTQA